MEPLRNIQDLTGLAQQLLQVDQSREETERLAPTLMSRSASSVAVSDSQQTPPLSQVPLGPRCLRQVTFSFGTSLCIGRELLSATGSN
ncbi:hypothetical protein CSUI_005146 [Cystoisospora suis]|uniref:Uncharacterized protein n=1 Tax=Cystoisospora suis TaxID=483139 RepID=A0A2C6KYN8_9APIC|nr:hypothetical protein CSUI_005146 [Cystoisospora suis]